MGKADRQPRFVIVKQGEQKEVADVIAKILGDLGEGKMMELRVGRHKRPINHFELSVRREDLETLGDLKN